MSEPTSDIPKGSWILVTGATGFLASQLIKQLLERGYRVRGTVRDLAQASWLVDDLFKSYADNGDLELALVADLGAPNAFDEAVRGVAAIAHVATISTFDPNPEVVVPQNLNGATNLLDAAQKEPSVKALVYTSTAAAGTMPVPGNATFVGRDTWNDAAVEIAWAPPPYEASRAFPVYIASKIAAEKAVMKVAAESQGKLRVTSIGVSQIIGEPLSKKHSDGFASYIRLLYQGALDFLIPMAGASCVDVKDVALLHVAAILDPEVGNERFQAWGHLCNWNDLLAILRKLYPQRKFVDDLPNMSKLDISADFSLPFALLKKWAGQDGWRKLEDTVADGARPLPAWYGD